MLKVRGCALHNAEAEVEVSVAARQRGPATASQPDAGGSEQPCPPCQRTHDATGADHTPPPASRRPSLSDAGHSWSCCWEEKGQGRVAARGVSRGGLAKMD